MKQLEYLKALCYTHHIEINHEFNTMSRSEASKLIDKIISEHGKL